MLTFLLLLTMLRVATPFMTSMFYANPLDHATIVVGLSVAINFNGIILRYKCRLCGS